jgi:hypothetical protein
MDRHNSMFVRRIVVAATWLHLPNCNSSRGFMLLSPHGIRMQTDVNHYPPGFEIFQPTPR